MTYDGRAIAVHVDDGVFQYVRTNDDSLSGVDVFVVENGRSMRCMRANLEAEITAFTKRQREACGASARYMLGVACEEAAEVLRGLSHAEDLPAQKMIVEIQAVTDKLGDWVRGARTFMPTETELSAPQRQARAGAA